MAKLREFLKFEPLFHFFLSGNITIERTLWCMLKVARRTIRRWSIRSDTTAISMYGINMCYQNHIHFDVSITVTANKMLLCLEPPSKKKVKFSRYWLWE